MVSREETYTPTLRSDDSDKERPCRERTGDPIQESGGETDEGVVDNQADAKSDKNLLQSLSDTIAESLHSVKDVVSGGKISTTGDGEEKRMLQSVGTRIVNSAHFVKDTVMGSSHEKILTDPDETGEASILVHSILD